MFDFALFFLLFVPLNDLLRQFESIGYVKRVIATFALTTMCGSYFVYESILAGKSIHHLN